MKKLNFSVLSLCAALFLGQTVRAAHAEVAVTDAAPEKGWPLTGREVLVEVSDPRGIQPDGIYAIDPSLAEKSTTSASAMRLLIKNASAPAWSFHHKRLAYFFNGQVWVCDLAGNKVPVSKAPPEDFLCSRNNAIRWAPNGILYFCLRSISWGTQTFIGFPAEDTPLKDLRQTEDELFENRFSPLIPLAHREPQGVSSSGLKWHDVLSTNEASFSPDGARVAVEIYPSSPLDLRRNGSHIQIYDLFKWTEDQKANDSKMEAAKGWFAGNFGYISATGPGVSLTKEELRNSASEDNIQVTPRWSPLGQWIAYTSVDLKNEQVLTSIIHPDGTNAIVIALPKDNGPIDKWTPVAKAGFVVTPPLTKNTKIWGDSHRMVAGWSQDGQDQYLWMAAGSSSLWVAKQKGAEWMVRSVPLPSSSEFGIISKAFRGSKVVIAQDSGDIRKITNIGIVDTETDTTSLFPLRSSLQVKSLDW